jgi:hypothetical protein
MSLRKLILTAALAAFFTPAHSLEADKKMHMGVSFALGFALANQWPNEPLKAWGVAMVPGRLMEVSDRGSTGFSGADLAANAIGAALGVATGRWLVLRQNGTTVVAYQTEF